MKEAFGEVFYWVGIFVLVLVILWPSGMLVAGLVDDNPDAVGWSFIIFIFFTVPIGFFAGMAIFAGSMMKGPSSGGGRRRRRKYRASNDDGTLVLPDGTVVKKPEL